ncbi:MAG: Fic family protein [Minisyncoccales bacterium]|jgi:Fic family protein
MNIPEKLKFIQKVSGLTQEETARRLGVTFASFNRWINGRAVPRKAALEKIDRLYLDVTGQKEIPAQVLEAKKILLAGKSNNYQSVIKTILDNPDIRDQLILKLTYHSNRIEGSTLSEAQTAAILFDDAAVPDKTLVEHLEAKNHKTALEYMFDRVAQKKPVDEEFILKLHGILMNSIRPDAGAWREHGVRIVGANVPTANYLKISELMKELVKKINLAQKDIIALAAGIHVEFERIHPFSDGNGRIGRMILNAMLLRKNYAPAVILQENRRQYSLYLNKAQTGADSSKFEDFIGDAVLAGFAIIERE